MRKFTLLSIIAFFIAFTSCEQVVEEQEQDQADKIEKNEAKEKKNNKNYSTIPEEFSYKGFDFPVLPYQYDALEPFIDAETVKVHYDKHHKGYFKRFVNAIKGTELESLSIENIFRNVSEHKGSVKNNGGGFYNHILYWNNLSPDGGGEPQGALREAITNDFGSFDAFKEELKNTANSKFGSGWAWLCLNNEGKLFITATNNQINPLMDVAAEQGIPLLAIDVWEHAYYLKYQNKRADYIDNIWDIINWEEVKIRYNAALVKLS